MRTWQPTNMIAPEQLEPTRVLLHYAIQLVAVLGNSLAEWQADASHASLEWQPEAQTFRGALIQAKQPLRGVLEPVTLRLTLLDVSDRPFAVWSLQGKTLSEGMEWLQTILAQRGAKVEKLQRIDYRGDFPESAIATGAPFVASSSLELQTLTAYFANTYFLLQDLIASVPAASPIRIWPHHFDMATLITVAQPENDTPRTIGLGLSPGDRDYNEPYWYAAPWPYPADVSALEPLPGQGHWHTQGWVGAVLPASQLTSTPEMQVKTFFNSAFVTLKACLQTGL